MVSIVHLFSDVMVNVPVPIPIMTWSIYLLYKGIPIVLDAPPEDRHVNGFFSCSLVTGGCGELIRHQWLCEQSPVGHCQRFSSRQFMIRIFQNL